jgi:hypothetical protein
MTIMNQIRYFASFLIAFALFFWAWALKNTMALSGNLDFGVVSFGALVAMSSYVLGMANAGVIPPQKSVGGILFLVAPLVVALNYVGGAILGFTVLERPGFGIYCSVFVLVWIVIAWYAHEVLKKSSITIGPAAPTATNH